MTYRYVPQRWRLIAQLATLAVTAGIGLSLVMTPHGTDAKLSQIENAMNADVWGIVLIVAGVVGFFTELLTSLRKTRQDQLFWLVSACHTLCMALMVAYGAAALVGLVERGMYYNFAAPLLAALLALWHFIYIQRKPHTPMEMTPHG